MTNDLSDYGDLSVAAENTLLGSVQKNVRAAIWTAPADHLEASAPLSSGEADDMNTINSTVDEKILYGSCDG